MSQKQLKEIEKFLSKEIGIDLTKTVDGRYTFGQIFADKASINLLDVQIQSFNEFLQKDIPPEKRQNLGMLSVFNDIFPVKDYNGRAQLEFVDYEIGDPEYNSYECKNRGMTYGVSLKIRIRLIVFEGNTGITEDKIIRDIKEDVVYIGEIPLMTNRGTFIVNGAERTIVNQLIRSPGVSFSITTHASSKQLYAAKIIPARGSWLEFQFDVKDILYVRLDRKKKVFGTILLRALGFADNDDILSLYYTKEKNKVNEKLESKCIAQDVIIPKKTESGVEEILILNGTVLSAADVKKLKELGLKEVMVWKNEGGGYDIILGQTLKKDKTCLDRNDKKIADKNLIVTNARVEIFKKLRPGERPTIESVTAVWENLFQNENRYNLSKVGRYRMNKKLGMNKSLDDNILGSDDIIEVVKYLINLRFGIGTSDDIDHLGNRRVKTVGELLENQLRIGLTRMERSVHEQMNIQDLESTKPGKLINVKAITSSIQEFFNSSQLSQFLDQTNPLAELTHKRRLSALGPGGLTRDTAGFEVRDVHLSHYGRMCPIETPEGPNIGLIASLSSFARINEYGFIETPYKKVKNTKVTDEIQYLTADEEDRYTIAQANAEIDENGQLVQGVVSARYNQDFIFVDKKEIDYIDVSPKQLVSVSTSLIPFLEHDDANRALMGSNMQRQSVPLVQTERPYVGTGMERKVAVDTRTALTSEVSGIVDNLDATKIDIKDKSGEVHRYNLLKFQKSNQNTTITQRPIVNIGDKIEKGDIIADGPATAGGELALGRNILVAFMPWRGYNFEDAIVVSERLVKSDIFTSYHIEELTVEARETKLGKEIITADLPNISKEMLEKLDEDGIIRIGAQIKSGDVLVGKLTPKGETKLTAEQRIMEQLFGQSARDVKDTSLKAPPGVEGTVIKVKVYSRGDISERKREVKKLYSSKRKRIEQEKNERINVIKSEWESKYNSLKSKSSKKEAKINQDYQNSLTQIEIEFARLIEQIDRDEKEELDGIKPDLNLQTGVNTMVKIYVAKKRRLSVGDKMAGRHGNKGVLSKIVPEEDMPYLDDGTPIDMILNPLGVPSRMNVGQIFETYLGWVAKELGIYFSTPVFEGVKESKLKKLMKYANLDETGKVKLRDGYTGDYFDSRISVGYMYILKLNHLAYDKIHSRSIGPYSLITQQPLGGKAQFGGQRFGEMEVWALYAYGASHILQELLTYKSDDVEGRMRVYEAIVKSENIPKPGIPASFNVLTKELRGLCLDFTFFDTERARKRESSKK